MQRREAELARQRSRAIELLDAFLARHPAARQRADALYRLAELQWERAEAELLDRMSRYEQELDAFREGKGDRRPPEPRIDLGVSLLVYEEILERHPDFPSTDTVLYLYGFGLNEQGDEEAALGVFRSLLARFPGSSFVPDAHLAIGEHHFAKGRFDAALRSYADVLGHIDSPLYDLALYKTAWCHFKQGNAKEAAEHFKRVLSRSRQRKQTEKTSRPYHLSAPSADLEREALEDLAFTFSEYGGAKEAYRFMEQVGGEEYSIRVLRRLGEVFFRQARYDQAIDSYRMLVGRFPLAENNPEHQSRIAEAFERRGEMEKSLAERRRLAERYGPGSSWVIRHADKPEIVAKAVGLSEEALRFVALYRHKKAQQTQRPNVYREVEKSYREYLKMFPETDQAPTVHFYLGEVLFKLGAFGKAAVHYREAAGTLQDAAQRKDAAYAAVLSCDRLRRAKKRPKEPPAKKQPLDEAERSFAAAVDEFARLAPDDEKLPQLRFEVGRLYYDRGRFAKSAEQLLDLVDRYPKDEYAEPAADLALDCFSRSGKWAELEQWARRFIEQARFAGTGLGEQLPGFVAAAVFQGATALARRKKHEQAAREYLRLVDEFPEDRTAPKALFNAAVSLEKAGEKRAAVEQYRRIVKRYPHKAADALFVIAGIYERQYDYAAAAGRYADFARRFAGDQRAAGSLWQAALLYRALRSFADESRALADFTRAWPDHPKAAEALLKQAASLGRAGDHRASEKVLRLYLKKHATGKRQVREAGLQLGLALASQGKHRQAQRRFERCAAFPARRKPAGSELAAAAECRFKLGELVFAEYEKITLEPPMNRLARLLKQKAAKLKQAEALFTRVVAAGHMEWASAALFRIGDMYARFAQAIYAAALPKGLSDRELGVYRQELQSLAFPVEDKALSAFSISYKMARRHSYYSVWSERTVQMLRELDPARFPPEDEVRPATRWADSFTDFGLLLRRLPVPEKPPRARAKGGER